MKKFRKPLLFALALVPVAAVGGWFVGLYQFEMYDPAILASAMEQVGSMEVLLLVTAVQTVGYALFCGCFGYFLAERVGLMKPIRLEKAALLWTVLLSLILGIVFSLDYWTFGVWIPGIRESTEAGLTVNGWIASILYGGVIEEVMLRLFMMSLVAWFIWKVFFRKQAAVPTGVIIAANVISALLFAAGHLPATAVIFGGLTPMIVFRCFLLNGSFGLFFGWLYRKHGIQYAMLGHGLLHIVSKLIWTLAI